MRHHSSSLEIIFEDKAGYDLISERDKALIFHALLERNNFLKHIEALYLGNAISHDDVDYIHIQLFSDAGKNKRVYLVRVYAKPERKFSRLDDLDVIPLRLERISSSKVIVEKFKERIAHQKEEIWVAKEGFMRPYLIKVWRDFDTLSEDQQHDYEAMIEPTARYITGAAKKLQGYGMYPHTGDLYFVDASRLGHNFKAWVEIQGIIPGLSLAERFEDFSCRLKNGTLSAEEYNERILLMKIIAVSGYLQMWRILGGACITDPTARNILIEGTYEDGYFPAFFDIDRLTVPGRPLLEVLESLRRTEIGNNPEILLSGYVSTFAANPEDAHGTLERLLQLINSASRSYIQLKESIAPALKHPEDYHRTYSALHMRLADS